MQLQAAREPTEPRKFHVHADMFGHNWPDAAHNHIKLTIQRSQAIY